MALIKINTTKITLSGDKTLAETFIGPAKSQMNILLQDMSFQKLSQGVRRVKLYKDVFVECIKCFDYQECFIHVIPSVIDIPLPVTLTCFAIIFSTTAGSEAVLWDLRNNEALSPIMTKADLLARIEELEEIDIEVRAEIEAIYPETDNHVWTITTPNGEEHDCPVTQPSYLSGWYGWAIGYYWYLTTPYPSSFTYTQLGSVDTVTWDFDYIDVSPLPYPYKDQIDEIGTEDAEKSSYINIFQGRVHGVDRGLAEEDETERLALVAEFEDLTSVSWPGTESIDVWRNLQYWHPLFWYSLKDAPGSLQNLSTYGHGVLIADSWENGEWSAGGALLKDSLTWKTGGIATKIIDSKIDSILFEYVSVCHKFVDTYSTGMCDKDLCDFDSYFRIYNSIAIPNSIAIQTILDGTNAYRVAEGTHELVFNSSLAKSAQRHAVDMASVIDSDTAAIGHAGTDGSTMGDRVVATDYFKWIDDDINLWGYKISENVTWNIGYDNPSAQALLSWENSPAHWVNMIDMQLSEMGIGYAISAGGYHVFVQNFGHVDHRYPGFSPFNTERLKTYIDDNFVFDPAEEDTRLPRVYLVGSLELTQEQLDILKKEDV